VILEKMERDDRVLFCQIASDNEQAFQEVFTRYRSRLVSYLMRIAKSPEAAKELTQEIFLKLWINRKILASIESPQHYLFVIAKNKAIDYLRKVSLDSRMRQHLWQSIDENRNFAEEEAFTKETARRINEAIDKLSVQKQTVFRLSRSEGLTHDQIAMHLSISKNTVKNHIVATLKFIKDYLVHH
jgi:RNA polymerase sigma-70 factor (family 1)